jgi:hypothetical protein
MILPPLKLAVRASYESNFSTKVFTSGVPKARLAMDGSPVSIDTRVAQDESEDVVRAASSSSLSSFDFPLSSMDVVTKSSIDPFLPDDGLSDNTSHIPGSVDARKVIK